MSNPLDSKTNISLFQKEVSTLDMKFPGCVQVNKAENYTLINNSIAGCEKAGLVFNGIACDDMKAVERIYGNEVTGCYCCVCCVAAK